MENIEYVYENKPMQYTMSSWNIKLTFAEMLMYIKNPSLRDRICQMQYHSADLDKCHIKLKSNSGAIEIRIKPGFVEVNLIGKKNIAVLFNTEDVLKPFALVLNEIPEKYDLDDLLKIGKIYPLIHEVPDNIKDIFWFGFWK